MYSLMGQALFPVGSVARSETPPQEKVWPVRLGDVAYIVGIADQQKARIQGRNDSKKNSSIHSFSLDIFNVQRYEGWGGGHGGR